MSTGPRVIVQIPQGGAVDRQLHTTPPAGVQSGDVVVELGQADAQGTLEPAPGGRVVLSLPSPEALRREADTVRRVLSEPGIGAEPVIVVIEAADELRQEEFEPILDAAGHHSRAVILRVMRDG
jgi:hypothetical protein